MDNILDKHLVVIDFETLGVDVDSCPVMALGVCIGNATGKVFGKKEFIFPLAEQFNRPNMSVEYKKATDTLPWWSHQDRKELFTSYLYKSMTCKLSMIDVIIKINNFIFANADLSKSLLIANSPDFDTAILKNLYNRWGAEWPFNFRNNFDFRTAKQLMTANDGYTETAFSGEKHSALADAFNEYADTVNMIYAIKNSTMF